jgi:peptidoglycan/LPS O-acetylase OafA/YrhL
MVVASLWLRLRQLTIVTSLPAWLWTIFELAALSSVLLSGWYGTRLLSSLFNGRSQYAFAVYAGECGSFPAFGLLIGVLSFERGIVSRFLSATPLVILGEISYSVYLVHFTLVHWYLLHRSLFSSVPKTMLYIAYWLGVLGVSFVIWRAIEKPFQRWIRSCFRVLDQNAIRCLKGQKLRDH